MKAYIIGEVTIHDTDLYREYAAQTPGSIKPYGGKFIVRGGNPQTLEGEEGAPRIVVIEFPSMGDLKNWYHSDLYQKIIPIRHKATTSRLRAVDGIEETPLA